MVLLRQPRFTRARATRMSAASLAASRSSFAPPAPRPRAPRPAPLASAPPPPPPRRSDAARRSHRFHEVAESPCSSARARPRTCPAWPRSRRTRTRGRGGEPREPRVPPGRRGLLPARRPGAAPGGGDELVSYVCGTRVASANLTHESMAEHDPAGATLCVHSVVTEEVTEKQIGSKTLKAYVRWVVAANPDVETIGCSASASSSDHEAPGSRWSARATSCTGRTSGTRWR